MLCVHFSFLMRTPLFPLLWVSSYWPSVCSEFLALGSTRLGRRGWSAVLSDSVSTARGWTGVAYFEVCGAVHC